MNAQELLRRVCVGHLLLVGEVRAADVRESGLVDTKTGLKAAIWLITYFVELDRESHLKMAKILRRVPLDSTDPAGAPVGVEKGKFYVFEIESMEKKQGFLLARMSATAPALINADLAAMALAAPAGAARGSAA